MCVDDRAVRAYVLPRLRAEGQEIPGQAPRHRQRRRRHGHAEGHRHRLRRPEEGAEGCEKDRKESRGVAVSILPPEPPDSGRSVPAAGDDFHREPVCALDCFVVVLQL